MVERLREAVDNLVGMKVSDAPFEKVAPYMLDGLDVLVGAEALIGEGLAAGAAGAVSGSRFGVSRGRRRGGADRRLGGGRRSSARRSSASRATPR